MSVLSFSEFLEERLRREGKQCSPEARKCDAARKLERRREYWYKKEMEECSFRPQTERCPKWVTATAEASRRRRDESKRSDFLAFVASLERRVREDDGRKHRLTLRRTKQRGRLPSPPPPFRFS